jgi:single-strand DNA-binding protein
MYALKNKVQLIGNLGNAPEIKNLENSKKVAKFSMATNESYRNQKGEKVDETQWHNLVAFFPKEVKLLLKENSLIETIPTQME